MPNPFYNGTQGRLRAFWRLGLFAALYIYFFIVSTSIPGVREDAVAARGVFALLVAAALWFSGRVIDRRGFSSYGFRMDRRWLADLSFGVALGAFLMAAVFAAELLSGCVRIAAAPPEGGACAVAASLGRAFLLCAAISIQEEVFARAYLMRNLAEGFRSGKIGPKAAVWAAYAASSSVFGLLHAWNPNAKASSVLLLCLAGFLLGLPFFLSGELALSLGLHFGWNFFQGPVFGFRVSGTELGRPLIRIEQGGPAWFTGGNFGPEGGLAGILAMAAGAACVVLWMRRARPPLRPRWELSEYRPPSTASSSGE